MYVIKKIRCKVSGKWATIHHEIKTECIETIRRELNELCNIETIYIDYYEQEPDIHQID